MTLRVVVFLLGVATQAGLTTSTDSKQIFERGQTWEAFLKGVAAQRDVWLKVAADRTVDPALVARAQRASRGLQLVVVAEDRCPDSVFTVPYVAHLASSARIPLRVVSREIGAPLTDRYRTPDGRTATPTVILLRGGHDVGAWVERPAILQTMFLSMARSPESAKRFADRQAWYESDRGLTALSEIVALVEHTHAPK